MYWLPHTQLARVYGKIGRTDDGITLIQTAIADVERSGEHFLTAEMHRILGDLLLQKGENLSAAEAAYGEAIRIAREQSARFWELRATVSLCRFWVAQGIPEKVVRGHQMLDDLYHWFTEGFDLPDLMEARDLLLTWPRCEPIPE
jgi:tetratricopeptide (TPR) repeat protein